MKKQGSRNGWRLLVTVPLAIVVLAAVAWTGVWYWATSAAGSMMTAWHDREARAGRVYNCGSTAFGGFPFRFEVTCTDPSVDDQRAGVSVRASRLRAVSEVFTPTVIAGEIDAPVTLAPVGAAPAATMEFAGARANLRAMPGAERLAVVFDRPVLKAAPSGVLLATADQTELRGRFGGDGADGHPILDLEVEAHGTRAPGVVKDLGRFGPLAADGTDVTATARLHGLSDLTLKPLAQQLREIQAAGGRLEITNARLQQGELIVAATGALSLTPRGTLSGDLQLTVVDIARLIAVLGIEMPKEVNRFAPALDRLMPGLGNALRGTDVGGIAEAGVAMLGGRSAELEGHPAVTVALHFNDGAAHIGPFRIGDIPPLF